MKKRSGSFDKYVEQEMQNLDFAREALLTSIEEFNEPVEEALRYVIKQMGIKSFIEKSKVPKEEVITFLKNKQDFEFGQISKLLSFFKLEGTIVIKK